MSILIKRLRVRSTFLLLVTGAILLPVATRAQLKQPLLSDDNLKRVSDHVSVLEGFPNVVFVIGSRATLVVDTGLGERNGATVMRAEQKLASIHVRPMITAVAPLEDGPGWFDRLHAQEPNLMKIVLSPMDEAR